MPKKPTLACLQQAFCDHVTVAGEPPPGALAEPYIVSDEKASSTARLEIYRSAYSTRLLQVLTVDFPGLRQILGDDDFDRMGRDYLRSHPSRSPSVRWFGKHLESFLRATPPYQEHDLLAEMAAFEWAQGEAFDAVNSSVATMADLRAVPADRWDPLQLRLTPSWRRLDLNWNVPALWLHLCADSDKAPNDLTPQAESVTPERSSETVAWAIWRNQLQPHWRSLEADEAWALDAVTQNHSLGAICQSLCQRIPAEDVPARIVELFSRWLDQGIVAELL